MLRENWTKEELDNYVSSIRHMKETGQLTSPLPAITICRQAGARGELTAYALKQYLDAHQNVHPTWQVFEANLVDLILEKNALPLTIAPLMKEDKSTLWQKIQNLFSAAPSNKELFLRTISTIEELLGLGRCIIVGRGASFVAHEMPHVLRIRLEASRETAIRRIAKDDKITRQKAEEIWNQRNTARDNYIKTYFHKNPHKKQSYDIIINTDNLRVMEVADIIGKELKQRNLV